MPYAPFEFKQDGQPTGFDIDLVQQVADSLEVDLDVIDVSFDDITSGTSLNTNFCDVAISAMTITVSGPASSTSPAPTSTPSR